MPILRTKALVEPQMLVWAREAAGYVIDDVAKKISVKTERLLAAEEGRDYITINQLRSLSNLYKRPLAFFYLPHPPTSEMSLHDYRQLPEKVIEADSPLIRLEQRKAKHRRELAIQMYEDLEVSPIVFGARITLESESDAVGLRIRNILEVEKEKQFSWKYDNVAYNSWREAIETSGVLVFQASVNIQQMRGFSIWASPLPIIVVNSKDTYHGRIFTMLHELTHLMLRSAGLCNLKGEDRVEIFCNAVAGSALVPTKWLLTEPSVIRNEGQMDWDEAIIKSLSNRYRVSREVILRRLLTLGRTTENFYNKKREQYKKEYERLNEKKSSGGPDYHVKVLSSVGKPFTKLVIDSYNQERITLSDVSQYLGINLKHFDKIQDAVTKPTLTTGELV